MTGETNLSALIANMQPELSPTAFVFVAVDDLSALDLSKVHGFYREKEGITLILEKSVADDLGLSYGFVASCITLRIHSSLEAVGLTAAFSNTLAKHGISCNVVAAYYHDHIFVDTINATKAMDALVAMTNQNNTTL
ncbi:ACT domain-containing protein [Flagellimonas algicola]|uniref:ACT domain-containing protein n=1 Tax=Flagellimonas algicola TaxID=2583815 RepID=A0ABY2WKX6_9FLAO|nr:ACT domain-containing protein [Allomuricauda algicola]TMU55493.1 ACT domain-containing protein [Allomuricauda algicola]